MVTKVSRYGNIKTPMRPDRFRALKQFMNKMHTYTFDEISFQKNPEILLAQKQKQMTAAAKILDFETAAILRDEIGRLEERISQKKTASE